MLKSYRRICRSTKRFYLCNILIWTLKQTSRFGVSFYGTRMTRVLWLPQVNNRLMHWFFFFLPAGAKARWLLLTAVVSSDCFYPLESLEKWSSLYSYLMFLNIEFGLILAYGLILFYCHFAVLPHFVCRYNMQYLAEVGQFWHYVRLQQLTLKI